MFMWVYLGMCMIVFGMSVVAVSLAPCRQAEQPLGDDCESLEPNDGGAGAPAAHEAHCPPLALPLSSSCLTPGLASP